MHRKITMKDNIYLAIPFIIMIILYLSSSMSYENQSVVPRLSNLLSGKPLNDFLSRFEFVYGGSIVSVEANGYFSFVEFFIRKAAHFFSYFFLGFFWILGLRKRVRDDWLTILLSILLCIGYASFDELHQNFTPDRTALMADVILDTVGAIVGIITIQLLLTKKVIK